jgi:hypothetical protein
MKKASLLPSAVVCAALLVLVTAGCGSKAASTSTAASPSGLASPSAASPSDLASPSDPASPAPSEPTAESQDQSDIPDVSAAEDSPAAGETLLQSDGIGPVKIGMTESALVKSIGEPDSKSAPELWGADGLEHSDWTYAASGLTVNMAKVPEDGETLVYSIFAAAPCTLTTQRGVAVGTPKDTVLSSYADSIDPESNPDTNARIVIGSIYGGIVVDIENGAVKDIFVGASAE